MREPTGPSPLDPFIPEPDIDERFAVRLLLLPAVRRKAERRWGRMTET